MRKKAQVFKVMKILPRTQPRLRWGKEFLSKFFSFTFFTSPLRFIPLSRNFKAASLDASGNIVLLPAQNNNTPAILRDAVEPGDFQKSFFSFLALGICK